MTLKTKEIEEAERLFERLIEKGVVAQDQAEDFVFFTPQFLVHYYFASKHSAGRKKTIAMWRELIKGFNFRFGQSLRNDEIDGVKALFEYLYGRKSAAA